MDLAIIPALVYHGRIKTWCVKKQGAQKNSAKMKRHLTWQEHLKGFSDVRLKYSFRENVINFKPSGCKNIQDLDIKSEALGLTTYPILYTS